MTKFSCDLVVEEGLFHFLRLEPDTTHAVQPTTALTGFVPSTTSRGSESTTSAPPTSHQPSTTSSFVDITSSIVSNDTVNLIWSRQSNLSCTNRNKNIFTG